MQFPDTRTGNLERDAADAAEAGNLDAWIMARAHRFVKLHPDTTKRRSYPPGYVCIIVRSYAGDWAKLRGLSFDAARSRVRRALVRLNRTRVLVDDGVTVEVARIGAKSYRAKCYGIRTVLVAKVAEAASEERFARAREQKAASRQNAVFTDPLFAEAIGVNSGIHPTPIEPHIEPPVGGIPDNEELTVDKQNALGVGEGQTINQLAAFIARDMSDASGGDRELSLVEVAKTLRNRQIRGYKQPEKTDGDCVYLIAHRAYLLGLSDWRYWRLENFFETYQEHRRESAPLYYLADGKTLSRPRRVDDPFLSDIATSPPHASVEDIPRIGPRPRRAVNDGLHHATMREL